MPDRWERTEAALEAALQVAPEERASVLDRVCENDAELRREVESLLAAHEEPEGFLATSAESFAAPFVGAAAARESRDRPGDIVGLTDSAQREVFGHLFAAQCGQARIRHIGLGPSR